MPTPYSKKLLIDKLTSLVKISAGQAEVSSEIHLRNASNRPLRVELGATRPAIAQFKGRPTTRPRLRVPLTQLTRRDLPIATTKATALNFAAREKQVLDLDHSDVVRGDRVKTYMFLPTLTADKRQLLAKAPEYKVTMQLPKEAKRLVGSSVNPTRVRRGANGLICEFSQRNVYPLPVTVKWTDRNENVAVTKSVRRLSDNRIKVTIRLRNRSTTVARNLTVLDQYSAAEVKLISGQGLRVIAHNKKDPRLEFRRNVSLAARQTLILSYIVKASDIRVKVPATVVSIRNSIIAISLEGPELHFPPPPPAPKAAIVLPSGWGFDYKHGGDHHLNEHGMWCTGQNYDTARERLSWNTGCIYADKNFDDDYRWTVAHQILRFNPGYAHHASTPWLAKTGATTTHSDVFQHESLKQFSQAVVVLRGWRFDFTSRDHHINKMSIKITTTNFHKATGRVRWNTRVTYADKNFDDNYRYLYYYTILAFEGAKTAVYGSGRDNGGTAAHMGSTTRNGLKNYRNAMVIPVGWSFDYTSRDHHINEHNFKIQNVRYTPSNGKVSWSAHFNYSDKNFDDDYNWRYDAVIIASNSGEAREYSKGPYTDGGGLDSKSYSVSLSSLFKPITWTNGIKDGDETGVDCGGTSPARNMHCLRSSVNPGNASSSKYFSLRKSDQRNVVNTFATVALLEYSLHRGQDFNTFYSGTEQGDRYIDAVAWYVDRHMEYVKDGGSWSGAQSAYRTLTQSGHRGSKDFAGDCEDHAILRAALLRSLGMRHSCIFCADHHNSVNQGQKQECGGGKKKSGGHTYNVVVYKGKYRILDYGTMRARYWANLQCWDQHATDNLWNDHTGKHWSKKDTSPYGSSHPMVNYPGNPVSPGGNWDWRTYFNDITP
jgi:hypothetical protein